MHLKEDIMRTTNVMLNPHLNDAISAADHTISQCNDMELWKQIQTGNVHAFDTLYNMHAQSVFNYGKLFLKDEEQLKDTLQDLFLEFWEKREKIKNISNIRSYLIISIRNRILNRKTPGKRSVTLVSIEGVAQKEYAPSFENFLVEREDQDFRLSRLQEAITRLSPTQQELVYLRFYAGLKNKEITEVTGLKLNNVSYHLCSAIEKLHEILKEKRAIIYILLLNSRL